MNWLHLIESILIVAAVIAAVWGCFMWDWVLFVVTGLIATAGFSVCVGAFYILLSGKP